MVKALLLVSVVAFGTAALAEQAVPNTFAGLWRSGPDMTLMFAPGRVIKTEKGQRVVFDRKHCREGSVARFVLKFSEMTTAEIVRYVEEKSGATGGQKVRKMLVLGTYKVARLECYEGRILYLIISADRLTALHASEGELSIERMRRARTAR